MVLACLAIFIIPGWLFLDALIDNVKELRTSFLAGSLKLPPPPSASVFIGLFTGAIVMSIGYKLFIVWINTSPTAENHGE
jgi:hypothetical protein